MTHSRLIADSERQKICDKTTAAKVLSWDMGTYSTPAQIAANEIVSIAICNETILYQLASNQAVPIHVEQFRTFLAQIEAQEQCLEVVDSDKATEGCESSESRLVELANDIRTRMKRSAMDIYYIGVNLLEAAQLLPHGAFMRWIQSEFEMSQRTAYRFMSVAKAFEGKFAKLANFNIAASALYYLATPSTPEAARHEAVNRALDGESITHKKARDIVKKHKDGKRGTLCEQPKPVGSVSNTSDQKTADKQVSADREAAVQLELELMEQSPEASPGEAWETLLTKILQLSREDQQKLLVRWLGTALPS